MMSLVIKCSPFIFSSSNFLKLNCRYIFSTSVFKISSTVNQEELQKFDRNSDEWWKGQAYSMLSSYNSVRVPFVRDGILSIAKHYKETSKPLEGFSILDVGCGGGILSEPLARLGAKVTGLDPGPNNIQAAMEHSTEDPKIKENLSYVCDTIENLATTDNKFDAVVASEVIEHVDNVSTFVNSCVELTRKDGSLFFTTINQTNASYFLSILMGEYVLGLIPKGTHDWNKFVKPEDLMENLESLNCRIISLQGVTYNPLTKRFAWCTSTQNAYALHAIKL